MKTFRDHIPVLILLLTLKNPYVCTAGMLPAQVSVLNTTRFSRKHRDEAALTRPAVIVTDAFNKHMTHFHLVAHTKLAGSGSRCWWSRCSSESCWGRSPAPSSGGDGIQRWCCPPWTPDGQPHIPKRGGYTMQIYLLISSVRYFHLLPSKERAESKEVTTRLEFMTLSHQLEHSVTRKCASLQRFWFFWFVTALKKKRTGRSIYL